MPDLELTVVLPQNWIEWFESDSEQPASSALTVQKPQCTNETVNVDTVKHSQSQFCFRGSMVCEHECRTMEQPAARQVRLDRKWICKHEHRAAEQSAAMQAWNDAEEQNSQSPQYCRNVAVFI